SVNEQSGITAGESGFQIAVGGNTHLKGGVIASTADAGKNTLSTGSLTAEDIQNGASYKASSVGIGGGGSSGGGFSASPSLGIPQSEGASSTTRSGISAGSIEIRNGDSAALATIDRNVTALQQDGFREIFDERKVNETMELGWVAGEVGFTAAGDLAGKMGWEEGGKERTILHTAVGVAMAALGGGDVLQGASAALGNQLAINKMKDYLTNEAGLDPDSAAFSTMMQLGSLALGAVIGGETGAVTALSATQNNWLKHKEFEELKEAQAACGQKDPAACKRVEELNALDKQRDSEYAAYATSVLQNMRSEGVEITEESFSDRMEGYWEASGVDKRDVVYPEGGYIPTYPTRGQELYAFLGRAAENLPDWYPGKPSAELSGTLMQGLLEQGGEAVAGWSDLFNPGEGINWFTGESVNGVDAWEARFGSGAESVAGLLTGGVSLFRNEIPIALRIFGRKVEDLALAASNPINKEGLTEAARALTKHASGQRSTGTFPPLSGGIEKQNEIAKSIVNEIITNPESKFRNLGRGGLEVRAPDGRGLRFNADGSFSGFIDPGT
ncbi:MAG TPA: hypothetical protein VFH31_21655, partial [Pyrinomonadaceae bacterium]|nr:hypothetical protein [Pyrinomonadaceae bacterium]